MGTLNKEVKFINDAIGSRQEVDFSSFSKFLENAPIFVTYYKQNIIESTADEGFQNVQSFTGDESPIKYNKIKNVPLYGVNMSQLDLGDGETGFSPSFNTDGVLLPGTFVPIPNDYLTIDYMDQRILFKVLEVSSDTIKSNHYYKINFKFNKIHDGAIEEKVTENFTIVYDNIGTEDKAILTDDEYNNIEQLEEIYNGLQSDYLATFFKRDINSFVCSYTLDDRVHNVYNKYLTEFIRRNELIKDYKNGRHVILAIETFKPVNFNLYYNDSIYRRIETCDMTDLDTCNRYFVLRHVANRTSILFNRRERYNDVELSNTKEFNMGYDIVPQDLIDAIKNNTLFETDGLIETLYNILIQYFNRTEIDQKYFDILDEKRVIYYDPTIFMLVPFVMYVIRCMIDGIVNN